MVKNRHNHTCGLREMLIEVLSTLSFRSINQGECVSEFQEFLVEQYFALNRFCLRLVTLQTVQTMN